MDGAPRTLQPSVQPTPFLRQAGTGRRARNARPGGQSRWPGQCDRLLKPLVIVIGARVRRVEASAAAIPGVGNLMVLDRRNDSQLPVAIQIEHASDALVP